MERAIAALRGLPSLPLPGPVVTGSGTLDSVICLPCRHQDHQDCPGGTWCDCQHQQRAQSPEPGLGWIRQG